MGGEEVEYLIVGANAGVPLSNFILDVCFAGIFDVVRLEAVVRPEQRTEGFDFFFRLRQGCPAFFKGGAVEEDGVVFAIAQGGLGGKGCS